MKKYWFKPKNYGCGFYPISIEGWISTVVFIILIFISAYINGFFEIDHEAKGLAVTTKDGLRFLLDVILLAGLFTVMFKDKLEGGLQWKWGKDKST